MSPSTLQFEKRRVGQDGGWDQMNAASPREDTTEPLAVRRQRTHEEREYGENECDDRQHA